MRLISAGSLVRAQSGPRYFRISICDLTRCSFLDSHLQSGRLQWRGEALLKIENKQTAPDRSPEIVPAPEMRRRMPEFEYAPAAKRGDQ
jgi:hypothetical protein